ncbi:MAG: cation diffusion facilitator CzcD-associated flavoprotein CzcO [Myxococcota bacterium]|jgi:cation diffusion facilitator CzcD-associated flavoprotein CzcO
MGAAIKLDQSGQKDWLILESADEVGGTWRDNTYPGAACDIPSHLYSYSFAEWDWTEWYGGQREILDYAIHVSHRFGLRQRIRFKRRVTLAQWVEADRHWELQCDTGEVIHAAALVGAIGGLRDPSYPAIPGRETFEGTAMHTARWDHDAPLEDTRIGVIGTGASAIQVAPALGKTARSVHVFQRTPPWLVPRENRSYTAIERALFKRLPGRRRLHRARLYARQEVRYLPFGPLRDQLNGYATNIARQHLRKQIADPALRHRLAPTYAIGCKRILVDDAYYAAMGTGALQLEDAPIESIIPSGIRLQDGREHDLDALVFATGFTIQRPLGKLTVRGRNGQDLAEAWGNRPQAYLGMTMPGFPNFFMMVGPNAGLGHNSVIFIIESELNYIVDGLALIQARNAVVDLKPQAMNAWQAEIDRRSDATVWSTGCRSWYLNDKGQNFTLWPGSTVEYRLRTRRFDTNQYAVS